MCHVLKEEVHPQANVPFHQGMESLNHPAQGVANRHTGAVAYNRQGKWDGDLGKIFGIKKYKEVPYMTCCNADPSHPGCQVYHPCCQQPQGAQGCKNVFSCCGTEGEDGIRDDNSLGSLSLAVNTFNCKVFKILLFSSGCVS